jgi:hypothetical protein
MGFSRLGLAFGGALGYAGGGWLFDAGKALSQPTAVDDAGADWPYHLFRPAGGNLPKRTPSGCSSRRLICRPFSPPYFL